MEYGQNRTIGIGDVVKLLGLEMCPGDNMRRTDQFRVRCPFCDPPGKYHMYIDTEKNAYFCFRCMNAGEHHSGFLDLYSRVRNGRSVTAGPYAREVFRQLCEETGGTPARKEISTGKKASVPASDERLDAAYRALLELPDLALNERHGKELLRRGISPRQAAAAGYASGQLDPRRGETPAEAGGRIAAQLEQRGIDLRGVPGFYEETPDRRCLLLRCGLWIPVRNLQGQIVGIQVRRDDPRGKGPRYLTLSAGNLPGSPASRISRVHAPLHNPELRPGTEVWITEGPLKADAAQELLRRRKIGSVAFLALPGVSNIRELREIAPVLRERGIRQVTEVFDMDKLVNPSVARAALHLDDICSEAGLRLRHMFWDRTEIRRILQERGTASEPLSPERLSLKLQNTAELLNRQEEDPGFRWNPATKGIDDYLKNYRG